MFIIIAFFGFFYTSMNTLDFIVFFLDFDEQIEQSNKSKQAS